jgi:uncharacterized membrane protein
MIRYCKTHPRFSMSVFTFIILAFALPQSWLSSTRILVAWDIGTALYLFLAAIMMQQSNVAKIRRRAGDQYEGKVLTLALTTIAAAASLVAIVEQLATAKALGIANAQWHVALAGITVFLSWTFMQTMFALHYAHDYYIDHSGKPAEGLRFPGESKPDYWDFVYFAFIIGASAQTADVSITSKAIRRLVTLHSTVAFFFNAIILALTISIGAGLFE